MLKSVLIATTAANLPLAMPDDAKSAFKASFGNDVNVGRISFKACMHQESDNKNIVTKNNRLTS